MKQEDKDLLLKDLCARLPYGVKFNFGNYDGCDYKVEMISPAAINNSFPIEDCKPYLRPMSSMTEEEKEELNCLCYHNIEIQDGMLCGYICAGEMNDVIDWLNKNMFDYLGLIPLGLAIEVTENNNPYRK